jgi:hypothetical protein
VLDGTHTDSCEFLNLQVMKALERHGESHFLELIGYVMADHGWGRKETGVLVV